MEALASFTANPRTVVLRQLLHELNTEASVLLILNHPYWDAESVGPDQHRDSLAIFLQKYGHLLHGLEAKRPSFAQRERAGLEAQQSR
jgi:hypothetical protein